MNRPAIITAWAMFLALGFGMDIFNAIYAYAVAGLRFEELNPGVFLVYRPIAWVAGLAIPIGLWFMRQWAAILYVLLQISGVLLIHLFGPPWAGELPAWALPVALIFPAMFLATVLPYWSRMSARLP